MHNSCSWQSEKISINILKLKSLFCIQSKDNVGQIILDVDQINIVQLDYFSCTAYSTQGQFGKHYTCTAFNFLS